MAAITSPATPARTNQANVLAAHFTASPAPQRHHRTPSSPRSSTDSSDEDGNTSDQSDDIAPETGFDPFLAATRRARQSSVASRLSPTATPTAHSSPTTSEDTVQSIRDREEAERWANIDAFWSKVVEDTMFRSKQAPIDLSSKGINVILPKIADLSRYVALPPPRYENEPKQTVEEPSVLSHSKTGGMVRHESYLAPFSSHQHYDSSTLGARALSRSKSAFQPSMRTQSFARTNSAMSALSSRSGGSAGGTPGRFRDPRDKQATLNLFLAQNALTKLPSAMFQLANLRVLSLRFNQLERLPPAIGDLQNLTELNIANNQLRYLPAEILRLRLEVFNFFPNPFLKPPKEGRLTVRPILSVKAKHGRHSHLQRLTTLDETPIKDGGAGGNAAGVQQPPPVIRVGGTAAATSAAAGGPGRQRQMDRTRSEAQVEGFLASGMGRLGVAPSSGSIMEDDGEDSFDADSTFEAVVAPFGSVPAGAELAQGSASSAPAAGLDDADDERSRILAAAFDDSDDEDPAAAVSTAADAGWLKGKVEGRSRVLGQKEVAPLPTLQELCIRRLLGAYDTAEGEANGLVSPFLSPMISAAGGARRRPSGPRRNGSKPGTPLWGTTPKSSRTFSSRSISFSSSTGSESGLLGKRTPTLLEAYENGTLQSLEGELGRGLVPLLEAARRSATRDWGTKARVSRRAGSRKKPARAEGYSADGDGDATLNEDHDTFGGIEAEGSLDRGDDACDNPWFSRCPNPRHLVDAHGDSGFGYEQHVGGRPTFALHRSRGHGSSSSVSSLGTTLGLGGAGGGGGSSRATARYDDDVSETRSVAGSSNSVSGRHSPISQASSTDTLGGGFGTSELVASASTPQFQQGGFGFGASAPSASQHGIWSRGASFSRSNSSSSSSFVTGRGMGGGGINAFGRPPSAVFARGFSTSSALSASGLRSSSSFGPGGRRNDSFASAVAGGRSEEEQGGRDWPLDEIEHRDAPVFYRAGETRIEWISHIAGKKVSRTGDVVVDLEGGAEEAEVGEEEGQQQQQQQQVRGVGGGDKGLIPILWRGCSKGCLDFLV